MWPHAPIDIPNIVTYTLEDRRRSQRIAFALGAVPAYADAVGPKVDSATFFVGSLFFTSAAALAWRNTPRSSRGDWWADAVQFVGTLFFNASTFHALQTNLSASEADRRVWRPDALGSVCFLVASFIALYVVGGRIVSWLPRRSDWWVAVLNLLGSIAFGVSAVASFVVPATGNLRNAQNANAGTFVGAVCFFAGAFSLLLAAPAANGFERAGTSRRDDATSSR